MFEAKSSKNYKYMLLRRHAGVLEFEKVAADI